VRQKVPCLLCNDVLDEDLRAKYQDYFFQPQNRIAQDRSLLSISETLCARPTYCFLTSGGAPSASEYGREELSELDQPSQKYQRTDTSDDMSRDEAACTEDAVEVRSGDLNIPLFSVFLYLYRY